MLRLAISAIAIVMGACSPGAAFGAEARPAEAAAAKMAPDSEFFLYFEDSPPLSPYKYVTYTIAEDGMSISRFATQSGAYSNARQLPAEELAAIREEIEDVKFFDLPEMDEWLGTDQGPKRLQVLMGSRGRTLEFELRPELAPLLQRMQPDANKKEGAVQPDPDSALAYLTREAWSLERLMPMAEHVLVGKVKLVEPRTAPQVAPRGRSSLRPQPQNVGDIRFEIVETLRGDAKKFPEMLTIQGDAVSASKFVVGKNYYILSRGFPDQPNNPGGPLPVLPAELRLGGVPRGWIAFPIVEANGAKFIDGVRAASLGLDQRLTWAASENAREKFEYGTRFDTGQRTVANLLSLSQSGDRRERFESLPMVLDGISMTISAGKNVFEVGEPIVLTVEYRNISNREILVPIAAARHYVELSDVEGRSLGEYRAKMENEPNGVEGAPRDLLAPGAIIRLTIRLDKVFDPRRGENMTAGIGTEPRSFLARVRFQIPGGLGFGRMPWGMPSVPLSEPVYVSIREKK